MQSPITWKTWKVQGHTCGQVTTHHPSPPVLPHLKKIATQQPIYESE